MGSIRKSLGIAAVLGMMTASMALAQGGADDTAREKLLIRDDAGLPGELGHFPRGAPGTSTGSPVSFGANWGDVYAGAGFQAPIRGGSVSDGTLGVGMGFLNAMDVVGIDVSLTALSTVRSGFTNRMGLNVKVHKIFAENWGVAVGASSIYLNNQPTDGNASVYGVVSKVFGLENSWVPDFKALTLSLGAGNEGFRLENDINHNNHTIGVFGSAALKMTDQFAVIVDWPGQDLDVGVSIVPFRDFPLIITPAIVDLTGTYCGTCFGYGNATTHARFSLGVGTYFRF
jgi:hypothetical protein